MRKFLFGLIGFCLLFNLQIVEARSGCCSHHGGVSGCSKYGRVICSDGWTGSSCGCTPPLVYGCTDSSANNYNPNANRDNGSCTYTIYGCLDSNAINYKTNANTSDGSCRYEKEITEEEVIKYETEYIKKEDKNKTTQSGKDGRKTNYYKIVTDENGNEISKEKVREEIIEPSITEIKISKNNNKRVSKNNETESNYAMTVYIIFFIILILISIKSNNTNTILFKISKLEKVGRIILYILYFIFIIPSIIDFIILLKKQNNNN